MKQCIGCSVLFESTRANKIYCTDNCARTTYRREHSTAIYPYLTQCVVCSGEMQKKRGNHIYCSVKCFRVAYDRTDEQIQLRLEYQRNYQKKRWMILYRYESNIIDRPDFIDFIKTKIMNRRGDTVTVKALMKHAVDKLGIDFTNRDSRPCQAAIAEICHSLGGREIDRTAKNSIVFQWEREK